MIKNLPASLIAAVKGVIESENPGKPKDTLEKEQAIAAIKKNVEQGAMSQEVGDKLLAQYSEQVTEKADQLLEVLKGKKGIHPLAVHTKYIPRGSFDKHSDKTRRAHLVVAVGKKVRGIKKGEHLSDTDLDDMIEIGYKHKAIKEDFFQIAEELELLEAGKIIKDPEGRWNAHTSHMFKYLGLKPGAHLPKEGMPEREIQGVKVYVKPEAPKQVRQRTRMDPKTGEYKRVDSIVKSSNHRVMAICPHCEKHMSAGRLFQHAKVHDNGGVKEEAEQVNELSKKTLGNYIKKASTDKANAFGAMTRLNAQGVPTTAKRFIRSVDRFEKRASGIGKAVDRLTKEETLDEVEHKVGDLVHVSKELSAEDKDHVGKVVKVMGGEVRVQLPTGEGRAHQITVFHREVKPYKGEKALTGAYSKTGKPGGPLKEEVEMDEAKKSGKYAVISQQHNMDVSGNDTAPGVPHIVGHGLSYEDAHKKAKAHVQKELKTYPKEGGFRVENRKDSYHIVGDNEGDDVSWHAVHVRPISSLKEETLNKSPDTEDTAIVEVSSQTRELGHLLRKKVKEMSGAQQKRAAELAKGHKPTNDFTSKLNASFKTSFKEEIEADQNILVHLRKTIDDDTHETQFADGEKEAIPQELASMVLDHVLRLKPDARLQIQDFIQQSFENFVEVALMIQEGARQS